MKDDKGPDPIFKVSDRRTFNPDGQVKDPGVILKEEKDRKDEKLKEKAPKGPSHEPRRHSMSIDFSTFVTSLHTSAMMHFGVIPNPVTNQAVIEPEAAKQNIDILEMIEAKTKGNLDEEEANLLQNALYDLRMRFVEISKRKA